MRQMGNPRQKTAHHEVDVACLKPSSSTLTVAVAGSDGC